MPETKIVLSDENVEGAIRNLARDTYELFEESISCENEEESSELFKAAQAGFSLIFSYAEILDKNKQRAILDYVVLDYIERFKALTPGFRVIKLPTSDKIVDLARLGLSDNVFATLLEEMKEVDKNVYQQLLNLMTKNVHEK